MAIPLKQVIAKEMALRDSVHARGGELQLIATFLKKSAELKPASDSISPVKLRTA